MKYFLFILGCQYNYYDATSIAHLLSKMGYVLSDEKEADLIIALACSVKQRGVDRIFGKIHNWNKLPQKPKIIISACILSEDKKKLISKVDAIIDSKDIVNWLKTHFTGKGQSFRVKQCNNDYLPKGESRKTAYVPIMQGCDNFCSYCAVPYTRGREVSRSEKEILDEIKNQLKKGFNKILLLGQNVNSWDKKLKIKNFKLKIDGQLPFACLLQEVDHLPYDFTYNFMSSNPHDFTDDLIDTLSKLTKWEKILHLPLQSGDNEILKKMNRKYNANQYYNLIKNLKLKIKNLSVTTDIIVGFPTETEKQFQNTMKLCKKIGFTKAYVSQYSPRPNTVSANTMNDDVPKDEKKRRWTLLNNLINKKSA